MKIPATQVRTGMLIEHQGDLQRLINVTHVTPGKGRGMVQAKLRNIRTGIQSETRFRSDEKLERVTLEQHDMEFLYQDGDEYYFMNTETYEQMQLPSDLLGDATRFLTPNLRVQVEIHDGTTPLGVSLPKVVDMKVTETTPGIRNATVTNVLKPATTETGAVVNVPGFVEIGDVIRVDTASGNYVSRAK